jgi:tetratricopeptide (TPR) repeat protein
MSKARRKDKSSPRLPSLWLILIVLLGLGAIAYSNSFSAPFVFDDLLSIQKNANVRFGNLNWNILSGRALLYLTFTLNYIWTQQEVWSYHLVNLVFHLINGVLLFFVAENVFRRVLADLRLSRLYAVGAALFFLVHPLQTESVTYISSRSELLSTLLYLAAFLVFVSRPEARIGFLLSLLVAVLFILGMSAKETVISLPATLLLYDLLFLSKFEWRAVLSRWRFYITFVAGAVVVGYYVATVTLRGSIGPGRQGHLSVWHYFLTQLRAMVQYVYLTFFPVGLNLDYDFPQSFSLFEPKVIGALIFLSALLVLGWLWRRSQPIFAFSIFWFFLTLAPTSSVVPILDVFFEHRMYLPMVGISLSFPVFIVLATRYIRDRVSIPSPATVGVLLLMVLTVGTFRRNYVWGDEVRLFEDVLKKSPKKERAFNSLSWAHYKKGQYSEAIVVLQKALEVIPSQRQGFAETLGQLYLKTGRYDDAIVLFKDVLPLHTKPELIALVHNNIGVAYQYKWKHLMAQKDRLAPSDYESQVRAILTPASAHFAKAVETNIQMFSAWDSYIVCSEHLGTMDALESRTLAALEVEETFNDVYAIGKIAFQRGVAKVLARAGDPHEDFKRAVEFFERAEKLNGNEKLVYFNHAYALNSIQQPAAAIEKYLQAIALDTLFTDAHHNVGLIYASQGKTGEALEHFLEVLRYDPNHLSTNMNLARIYASQGNKQSARKHLEHLLRLVPGNQDVIQLWQKLGL